MNVYTIDWLTLKRSWLAEHPVSAAASAAEAQRVQWTGGSPADTSRWLTEGYTLPGFSGGQALDFSPRKRKRPVWSEDEGQIDRTRLRCGMDEYRLTRESRDKRRGAKVEIGYGFRAGVPAEVIGQYGKFAAGLIQKLEHEGLDVEVQLVSRAIGYLAQERGEIHLRVKREGERLAFKLWSAMFAPTGHRHLIFHARGMHRTSLGLAPGRVGGSEHYGWKVEREGDTVRLDCDSNGTTDPTATLENQAKTARLI